MFLKNSVSQHNELEVLETACLTGDEHVFDAFIDKMEVFSDTCVLNVCKNHSSCNMYPGGGEMLKKLLDRKCMPTIECARYIMPSKCVFAGVI